MIEWDKGEHWGRLSFDGDCVIYENEDGQWPIPVGALKTFASGLPDQDNISLST